MGCWNHTCFITGLPIYDDEEVEVIILQNANRIYQSSACYPFKYHVPIPLTFSGKYNDYGAVYDCHGPALNIIVDSIQDHLFEMEVGENTSHDIEAKKADFNIKKMFELDHEDRLQITNPFKLHDGEPCSISLNHIVIRKEVYDRLVENVKIDWWNPKIKETVYVNLGTLRQWTGEFIAKLDKINNFDSALLELKLLNLDLGSESLVGQMLNHTHQRGMNRPVNIITHLAKLRLNEDPLFDDLLDNAIRFGIISHFVYDTRRMWHIPSGLGSQNDNTANHKLCAEVTLSAIKYLDKKWDE